MIEKNYVEDTHLNCGQNVTSSIVLSNSYKIALSYLFLSYIIPKIYEIVYLIERLNNGKIIVDESNSSIISSRKKR